MRKKYAFGAILLFCSSLWHCAPAVWQQTDLARRQGKLQEAAQTVETYLQQHPDDAGGFYRLGEIYGQQARWEEMMTAFRRSRSLSERWEPEIRASTAFYVSERLNRGIAAQKQGRFTAALEAFRAAGIIEPENPLAFRLQGEAALAGGDTTLAISALETSLEKDPADRSTRRLLMRIFFATAQFQASLDQASHLEKALPDDREALRLIAYNYDRLNDLPRALTAYETLTADSASASEWQAYAALQFRCGRYNQARQSSENAIAAGGDRRQNLRAIAQILLITQNFRSLLETAGTILELDPRDRAALRLQQIAYAALGNSAAAAQIAEKLREYQNELP